jgi:hypothetical protein
VSQGVRPDRLGDPSAVCGPADDPRGATAVQSPAIGGQEHWAVAALADGQVDRPRRAWRQWDSDDLAALAGDDQRPVPALDTQRLDVGTGGFGGPQAVQGLSAALCALVKPSAWARCLKWHAEREGYFERRFPVIQRG